MKYKQSKYVSPELPNSDLFYITVILGTSGKGWDLKWDDLPFDHNVTHKLKCTCWTVHNEYVEEVIFNKNCQSQLNTEEKEDQNKTKISPELQI